jgi:hypothetical protein
MRTLLVIAGYIAHELYQGRRWIAAGALYVLLAYLVGVS